MKSKNFEEFVEKFKPKLTTDDCFTPPAIYDVVVEWADSILKARRAAEARRAIVWALSDKEKEIISQLNNK